MSQAPLATPKEQAIRKLLMQLDDYQEASDMAVAGDGGNSALRDVDGNRLSVIRCCLELRKHIDHPETLKRVLLAKQRPNISSLFIVPKVRIKTTLHH